MHKIGSILFKMLYAYCRYAYCMYIHLTYEYAYIFHRYVDYNHYSFAAPAHTCFIAHHVLNVWWQSLFLAYYSFGWKLKHIHPPPAD